MQSRALDTHLALVGAYLIYQQWLRTRGQVFYFDSRGTRIYYRPDGMLRLNG